MESRQTSDLYEFASFRLDVKKCRLTCGEQIVSLTPREFALLLFLIENAGRVVGKDELLEQVWQDAFVEEATLTRNISWLRQKLAVAGGEKMIETVPKRDYRFLPEVTESGENLPAVIENGENVPIIEEQIVRQIQIEETVETISPLAPDSNVKALPAAAPCRSLPLWISSALLIFAALGFLGYRALTADNHPKITMAAKIAPFSGLPGRENSPAFSLDGKQLVFAWGGGIENDDFDIYIKLIGTGEPIRLTTGDADEINPIFAPDGKSLAAAELDSANKNRAGIFTINLETGAKTFLTMPESPAVNHTPRFSPDGKVLAFIRYFSSFRREILVVPATGGEPRQITADDARIYGLAWNADGGELFYTSFRRVNQLNLWRVALDGKAEPQMIATNGKNLQDLAISPDSRTVAFVEETADENIREISGQNETRPIIRSTRADHSQEISPDGAKSCSRPTAREITKSGSPMRTAKTKDI